MITFPSLKLDEGTCYFLLTWEGPPEDAEILPYIRAEVALHGLSDDLLNMEIMKEVLCGVDESFLMQDMSRHVLLQALSDHLICGTLRIAFKSVIPRGTTRPAPPEEETPAAGAPSESQSSTQTCSADSISIKCGHSGRNFNLKVEKDQTPEVDTIRVISGATTNTADEMEVEVKGSCDQGRSDCPRVKVWGNGVSEEEPGSMKVKLLSREGSYPKENFVDFFKKIIVPDRFDPQTYHVQAQVCDRKERLKAKIVSVPKAGWSGTVTLGYSHAAHKDSNFNQNQGYKKLKVNGDSKISGSIKATYNEREWTLGGEQESPTGRPGSALSKGLFDGAQKVLDTLCPLLGEIKSRYATVTLDWPSLSVGGGIEAAEKADTHEVGLSGNIKIAFSPLLGVKVNVDILNIIIDVAGGMAGGPGLAKFLREAREWAAKEGDKDASTGATAKIGIDFITGASIAGDVEWKTEDGNKWDTSGGIKGEIGIELKGYASVEVKAFIIKAGAGVEVGAKSEFGTSLTAQTEANKPAATGKIYFTGITIYYSYYYGVNGEGTSNARATAPPAKGKLEDKFENKFVLVKKKEREWPDSSAKLAL